MEIELTFINQATDVDSANVAIFQKNESRGFADAMVAWTVIPTPKKGMTYPFTFSPDIYAGAISSHDPAYATNIVLAKNSEKWIVSEPVSGTTYTFTSRTINYSEETYILNDLKQGAVNGNIYRNNKLLSTIQHISPGQNAVYSFVPTIWIGLAAKVEQGEIMNEEIVEQINTEISLIGIKKASIIMSGGGPFPYTFTLADVQYA